ncbi:MAG: cytidine deaminase [Clostridiales bacterium]|nr:MAG: cytidine deaminase [Clostridiales bacterium]HJA30783.1 cytidine deaminase [Candidatus Eisenbergiella pullicola]
MEKREYRELIRAALRARELSYSPYSNYRVGAALLTESGEVFTGCNIENAAYTPAVCAERTAFFKAVSEGCREFSAIAIAGSPAGEMSQLSWPCGVCRQVMMEFCDPERFLVIVAISEENYRARRLKELLPEGFGPANLK